MSFGISLSTSPSAAALGDADALSHVTERAREAEAAGVDDVWLNQGLDIDAITVAAVVAHQVPRILVGTAVVPIYPRHPAVLASQAKAAQLAAGGRFGIGIGLGHQGQVEGVFGVPFDRPIGHLRDYLRVLRSLLDTGTADVRGATLTADLALVGDEETVAAGIRRYLDAGATDVRVSPAAFATDGERLRTWRLVGELARDAASRAQVPQA
jgi:alkanesulfonate monooxygenase SsuD/methylene tetrahydromethanopterin reductase-like flavin-dependent oxidoreductase (luciferase family)